MTLVEIAFDDIAGARLAETAGAGRLELCSGLADTGGTTPSVGFVREVAEQITGIPLMVLIRPRGGDFVYTADELRVMLKDVEALAPLGVGFVIGALEPSGTIDIAATRGLLAAAGGAPVTFHKAFDSTPDLSASLETLAELGVNRILTSGGRRTALDGAGVIRSLIAQSAGRVTLVAGGSVRPENVAALVTQSEVTEVHLRAPVPRRNASTWSNPEQDYESAGVMETNGETIRAVLAALEGSAQ